MVCVIVASEYETRVYDIVAAVTLVVIIEVLIYVQVIFLDKIPKVRRAHICLLIAQGVIYIEAVDPELVRHDYYAVIVYFSCDPMMSAD